MPMHSLAYVNLSTVIFHRVKLNLFIGTSGQNYSLPESVWQFLSTAACQPRALALSRWDWAAGGTALPVQNREQPLARSDGKTKSSGALWQRVLKNAVLHTCAAWLYCYRQFLLPGQHGRGRGYCLAGGQHSSLSSVPVALSASVTWGCFLLFPFSKYYVGEHSPACLHSNCVAE